MRLLRTLVTLVALAGIAYCSATVRLGDRTFFGHIRNIWHSDQTQDLVKGVKETSRPMLDRVSRGVKAGVRAAENPDQTPRHDAEHHHARRHDHRAGPPEDAGAALPR